MALEIEVKVLRGDDGKVNGISFVAGPEAHSEDFIEHFLKALRDGKAIFGIDDGKVVLEGPTFTGNKRRFEFTPNPEELEGLRASVFAEGDDGKKLTLKHDGILTPGFRLILRD